LTKGTGSWTKCCQYTYDECTGWQCYYLSYFDCCGSASACRGAECTNNCPQDAWCPGGLAYVCTIVSVGGVCTCP
jgi:hypothetical protein